MVEKAQVHLHDSHKHGCHLFLKSKASGRNNMSHSLLNRSSGFLLSMESRAVANKSSCYVAVPPAPVRLPVVPNQ